MQPLIAWVLRRIQRAVHMEAGQDLIEYALLIQIVAFGVVAGSMQMAKSLGGVYSTATTQLASAVAGPSAPGGSGGGDGSGRNGNHGGSGHHGGSGGQGGDGGGHGD